MSKRKFSKKEVAISIAAAALAIATVGGAVAIHKDSSNSNTGHSITVEQSDYSKKKEEAIQQIEDAVKDLSDDQQSEIDSYIKQNIENIQKAESERTIESTLQETLDYIDQEAYDMYADSSIYIPYAETETPSEAPQKQSSKAKSMEKTVSQSSPDVSTQEAAFPVTINCSLVDDIMDDKTFISRIPGSKLHIKLPLFSIADDGKTLVSAIDPQKEYEIFKNDSPTSNPLLNMKGAQILPYYDPVRRKNITKQFGQNQNKILKFSQNPASKHKPKSSPIRKKDLKL